MNFRMLSNSQGVNYGFSIHKLVDPSLSKWFHGLVVRTLDFESNSPSPNLGGTFLLFIYFECIRT